VAVPQQEKCHQYWPAERSARYQYFVVDPMAEYNMPQYILREFKVTDARVSGGWAARGLALTFGGCDAETWGEGRCTCLTVPEETDGASQFTQDRFTALPGISAP
jgi:hypothetical protein